MYLKSAHFLLRVRFEGAPSSCFVGQDGATFIDIGPIWPYSFSIAAEFKNFSNTRILAIEPHPIVSRRFAYNLSLNPDLPIELIYVGLGTHDT